MDLARSARPERTLLGIVLVGTQLLLVQVVRSGLLVEATRTLASHTSRWVIVVSIMLQVLVISGVVRLIRRRTDPLTVDAEGVSYRSARIAFSSIARLGFYQPATRKGLSGWYSMEMHDGRVVRFHVHPRDHHNPMLASALDAIEQRTRRRWMGRSDSGRSFRDFLGALRRGTSSPSGGGTWSWLARNTFTIQSHAAELNDAVYRWTTPLLYLPLIAVVLTVVYLLTPGVKLHYGVSKIYDPSLLASGLTPFPRLLIVLLVLGWVFTALGVNALVVLMRTQTRNREALEAQLEAAREVQMRLLPSAPPAVSNFELSAVCLPALEVGGDYYDFITLPSGRLVAAIADVSGKGLSAALLMTMVKGCLTTALQRDGDLPGAAQLLNQSLLQASPERTFVTMALAEVDSAAGTMRILRAGHNPPLLVHGDDFQWISPVGPALGMRIRTDSERRWDTEEVWLTRGDLVVFYTDGVTEEMSPSGEQYGSSRLASFVRTHRDDPIDELKRGILADVHSFRGRTGSSDDLTLVLIRRT